jgi:hypothetical protein
MASKVVLMGIKWVSGGLKMGFSKGLGLCFVLVEWLGAVIFIFWAAAEY